MASRLGTSSKLLRRRAENRPKIVPGQVMFPRYPPIRQLLTISDLCLDLDTTYDEAVGRSLGYENKLLDADEAATVLHWLVETEESNAW